MKKQDLILIGGGGHCLSCIDVIETTGQFNIVGILDQQNLVGTSVLGYQIIGTDDDLLKYADCQFLITVGQIKSAVVRKKIYQTLVGHGLKLATVISPKANLSAHAEIGEGTIIMHAVTVNANAKIGANCILNTACTIEHEVSIGNHTHISTAAVVNGGCMVGDKVFIGSNASIANHVQITNEVVVGIGSVVLKAIDQPGTYVGNPIKKLN